MSKTKFAFTEAALLCFCFLSATSTIVGASADLVITEIMYHPMGDVPGDSETGEYLELFNRGEAAINLSAYVFTSGITFTIPANTVIAPRTFLVVAKSLDVMHATLGIADVVGPYEGTLSNRGERLRLADDAGATVWDVTYEDHGDWPAAGDGTGHSIVLAQLDSSPHQGRNWIASRYIGGSPGEIDDPAQAATSLVELIKQGSLGRYFKGLAEPANATTQWTELDFELDAAWILGPSGYGYSNNAGELAHVTTQVNDMRGNYASLYVRLDFELSAWDLATMSELSATVNYDDGFVLYLNGTRVHVTGVSGNPPRFDTLADSASDYAPEHVDLSSRIELLREGRNVLALQGHNGNFSNSSDFVLAPTLTATLTPPPLVDHPGRGIVINEILASSSVGLDWIELYNPTDEAIALGQAWLSDDADMLNKYQIPDGVVIAPHDLMVIQQDEFGFGLDAGGEAVFLTEPNLTYVLTAYAFGPQAVDMSIGRYPDGRPDWFVCEHPTPLGHNTVSRTRSVVINEIMYHAPEGQRHEFVELYNAGSSDCDLTGWKFLGIEYRFPEMSLLPTEGLCVICDDCESLADKYDLDVNTLWGDFGGSLSNSGETLTLLDTDDIVIDRVEFDDVAPWPLTPDGYGASLERSCISAVFQETDDWRASPINLPSPLREDAWVDCAPPVASSIVISEIMYHPFTDIDDERRTEFIELYNRSSEAVDLDGWLIMGDVQFTVAEHTVIGPQDYLVIGWDPQRLIEFYGLSPTQVSGPFTGGLPNGGGLIMLVGPDGRVADSVEYDDDFPWPSLADGKGERHGAGHSLEKLRLEESSAWTSNWQASIRDAPTPAAQNSSITGERTATVVELKMDPSPVTANDSPTLQARIAHAQTIETVTLEFWLDHPEISGESRNVISMHRDDWQNSPDAEDGVWLGTLPVLPPNSVVRYRIKLALANGRETSSPHPERDAFAWHAYFVDPLVSTRLPELYHMFISSANWKDLHTWTEPGRVMGGNTPNPNWNNEVPAIFVADGIVYDVFVRHQGSRWGRKGGSTINFACASHRTDRRAQVRSWRIRFPSYRKHKGHDTLILQKRSGWPQHISFRMFELADVPAPQTTWAKFRINGCDYNNSAFQIERPGRDLVARWFGEVGDLFKSQGYVGNEGPWSWGDERLITGSLNGFTQQERYEYTYKRKTHDWVNDPEDGKSDLVEPLIQKLNAARAYDKTYLRSFLESHFDVDQTLRYICTINYVGTFDDMFQNHFLYRKAEDGKWIVLPWDMDNTLGGSFGEWNANPFRGADENRIGNIGNRSGWWNRLKDAFFIAFEEEFLEMFLLLNNTVHSPEAMDLIIEEAGLLYGASAGAKQSLKNHIERRHNYLNDFIAEHTSQTPVRAR